MSEADDLGTLRDAETGSSRRSRLAIFLVPLVAGVAIWLALDWSGRRSQQGLEDEGRRHPGVGAALKAVDLDPLTGTDRRLSLDDLKGQVVIMNYWGTWCPPCQVEFPHLVAMHERLSRRDDYRFVSVSCYSGYGGDAESLRRATQEFLDAQQADFPTYSDLEMKSRIALVQSIGVEDFAFPTTVVLDRRGVVRGVWVGYIRGYERGIERLAEELLDEPVIATSVRTAPPIDQLSHGPEAPYRSESSKRIAARSLGRARASSAAR